MRKMMMAALFSVVSLSACAVDPQQPDPPSDENVVDTSGQNLPTDPIETQPAAIPVKAGAENAQIPIEGIACETNADCPTQVCDLEKHFCRVYPF
jgi:hypothetical protein